MEADGSSVWSTLVAKTKYTVVRIGLEWPGHVWACMKHKIRVAWANFMGYDSVPSMEEPDLEAGEGGFLERRIMSSGELDDVQRELAEMETDRPQNA